MLSAGDLSEDGDDGSRVTTDTGNADECTYRFLTKRTKEWLVSDNPCS